MNSKKAITLLVLATLIIGLMPTISVNAIDLTSSTTITGVVKGDEVTITGDGVAGGRTVNAYWDDVEKEAFSEGSGKIASKKADGSGIWSIKFKIPEALYGDHYVYIVDSATGDSVMVTVTVDAVVVVSPKSGLKGDKITITGYGFNYNDGDDEGYDVALDFVDSYSTSTDPAAVFTPAIPTTNSLGTWTATMTVPDVDYADYSVTAADGQGGVAEETFTVGPAVTLSITEGPVGSVVTLNGRGFHYVSTTDFGEVGIGSLTINGEDAFILNEPVAVRSGGRLTLQFVVPTLPVLEEDDDPYEVYVTDGFEEGYAEFFVNGGASIKATPGYGIQGTSITVEGWNFTKIANKDVVVELEGAGAKTFKTDSKGYFKGTYQIPAVPTGTDLSLTATQAEYYIDDDTTIRVGVMLVIISPDSGPSGAVVSVTGVGFMAGADYELRIDDKLWDEGIVGTGGAVSAPGLYVPTLAPGAHNVKITELDVDGDPVIEVSSSLTVTETTGLELDPVKAANNYEITIEGSNYADTTYLDFTDWEFVLYNTTYDEGWPLTLDFGDFEIEEGDWTVLWTVEGSELLDLGTYTLNVTDPQGLSAEIIFEIVEPIVVVTPRKSSYGIGETVAFNLRSTFAFDQEGGAYFKIYDPGNNLYWQTDPLDTTAWVKVGTERQVPYYAQTSAGNPMVLPPDAPLGSWTWKFYVYDVEEDEWVVEKNGVFEVTPAAEEVLGQQIEDLNAAVTDLQTEISTVSTEVAGVKTSITNAINAANAAVQAANAATQAVNAVAQTANAASTAATNAANAATEAKNAANGLTTLVYGAIGASLVAALAAIVSLMQISRRIAG